MACMTARNKACMRLLCASAALRASGCATNLYIVTGFKNTFTRNLKDLLHQVFCWPPCHFQKRKFFLGGFFTSSCIQSPSLCSMTMASRARVCSGRGPPQKGELNKVFRSDLLPLEVKRSCIYAGTDMCFTQDECVMRNHGCCFVDECACYVWWLWCCWLVARMMHRWLWSIRNALII